MFNNDLHSKKSLNIKENIIKLRKKKKKRSGFGFQDTRIITKRMQNNTKTP